MRRLLLFVALAAAAWRGAIGDVVQTPSGRIEGKVTLAPHVLQVAGKSLPWSDVLFVIRDPEGRSIRPPEVLRTTRGEVWHAHLASLAAGRLKARLPFLGEREFDIAEVQAVDFLPDVAPPEPGDKSGTLYRQKGEPVPGRLMWIDEQRLAIDSPLGVLTLARDGLARYLFTAAPKPPAPKGDEVSLLDGTTLRGEARPAKDALELDHPALGKLAIPVRLVRSVLRRPPGVAWLGEMAPASVNATPLIVRGVPPETIEYPAIGGSRAWPGELLAIRGIRMMPKCMATYRFPALPGQGLAFAATLWPIEGMRGEVKLRLLAAGKTLAESTLAPSARPQLLAADVPKGAELAIEVDFGPELLFPSGVLLGDPMVVGR